MIIIKKIIKFFTYQFFYKFYQKKVTANSIYNKKNGITYRKYKFNEYNSYLKHQSFKFFLNKQHLLNGFNEAVSYFFKNFTKIKLKKNSYILCLGARTGAEVKAFRKLGFFSIGIDLAFPKNSPFVLYGDFHHLDFPEKSFDLIYSNTLDHVYSHEKFVKEILRVLKKDGKILFDIQKGINENNRIVMGQFETCGWDHSNEIIQKLLKFKIKLIYKKNLNPEYIQVMFKKS
jgi:SAM-dependent methyltransferase